MSLLQGGTIPDEDDRGSSIYFLLSMGGQAANGVTGAVSTARMGKPRCPYTHSQSGALGLFRLADPGHAV